MYVRGAGAQMTDAVWMDVMTALRSAADDTVPDIVGLVTRPDLPPHPEGAPAEECALSPSHCAESPG